MTEVLKHPLFTGLALLCAALTLMLGFSALQVRGLHADLAVTKAQLDTADTKLADLASASASREAAAKASAATALQLAKARYRAAAQITATPEPPAGADRCQAAAALIARTVGQETQ